MTAEKIDEVFSGMREGLVRIIHKVESSGVKPEDKFLARDRPGEAQKKISAEAMKFIGFEPWGERWRPS